VIRVLVEDAREGLVVFDGPRLHHLQAVLRLKPGDRLEVFDGRGRVFPATVVQLEPHEGRLTLGPARAPVACRRITVLQGLPKGDKLELIIQKGTELGAAVFAPVATERSVVRLAGKESVRQARWQRIAEEAARQCLRADVPRVSAPAPLLEAVAALEAGTVVLVLDEEQRTLPLGLAFAPHRDGRAPVAIVIGPEGGLSRAEVAALEGCGAHLVTLGSLVLRTETAALAALAVLRHLDGELG
jgi:16S rRNA (uracil1498-N3)-methyltransferase